MTETRAELQAKPDCCEEAHSSSREFYIPCNQPATHVVEFPDGTQCRVCYPHADHAIKNRGAVEKGDYKPQGPVASTSSPEPVYDYSGFETDSIDTSSDLGMLSALAEEARQAEEKVAEVQRELKRLQGIHQGLVEQQIPEIMERVGMMKFTTSRGLNIDLKEIIRASLGSGAEKDANLDWLEREGHEAIIKLQVSVPFGRGDDEREKARALAAELQARGIDAAFDRKVEPQTLGALIRELLEDGRPVPEESFHVFRQRVAKIK